MADEAEVSEKEQGGAPVYDASHYRVAVASTDGETVNTHYGKSEIFYIYYVDDSEGYDLVEKRKVNPVCMAGFSGIQGDVAGAGAGGLQSGLAAGLATGLVGGAHSQSAMEQSVKQFADCRYVVASRIGSGAAQALSAAGITGMELPGTIDDAILKIWKYNRIQGLFS